jgi:hypothetical protein
MSSLLVTGWASTKPGRTRYHFYDAESQSLCSYQRKPGALHAWTGTRQIPEDACSSCELHFKRRRQAPGPQIKLL